MADVEVALRAVGSVGSRSAGPLQSLATKQELLLLLLDDEQMRLTVWLYPLDHEKRHGFRSSHSVKLPSEVSYISFLIEERVLTTTDNPLNILKDSMGGKSWSCHSTHHPLSIPEISQRR